MHHLVFFSHRYKISLWIFDIWLRALKRWMSEEEEESMKSSLESDIAPSSPYPIRSPGKVCHWNCKKKYQTLILFDIRSCSSLACLGPASLQRVEPRPLCSTSSTSLQLEPSSDCKTTWISFELIFKIMELVSAELTFTYRIFHRNSSCLICQPDSLETGKTTDCQI